MLKNKNKNKNKNKLDHLTVIPVSVGGAFKFKYKSKSKAKSDKLKSDSAAKKSLIGFQILSLTGGSLLARRGCSKNKGKDFFNGLPGLVLDESAYGAVNPLNQRKKITEVEFGCIEDAYAEKLKMIKPPTRHPEVILDKIRFILDFSLKTNTLDVISNKIFKFLDQDVLSRVNKKKAISQLQLLFAPSLSLSSKNCAAGVNPGRLHYMQVLLK